MMIRLITSSLLLAAHVANSQTKSFGLVDTTLDVLLRTPMMKRKLEENYKRAVHKRLGSLESHGFLHPEEVQLGWGFPVRIQFSAGYPTHYASLATSRQT
jgi:hypothetical protein